MSSELDIAIRPILGVEKARRFGKLSWSWLAILDFLVVAGFIGLIHADLIFAPGQSIELPSSDESQSRRIEAVLTVVGELYLFDGKIHRFADIEEGFQSFFSSNEKLKGEATLLIKMDANAALSALLKVCEEAQRSGFSAVHIAENPRAEESVGGFGN